jgi:3-deoxy-D-manno-octulosonic-acid transferase
MSSVLVFLYNALFIPLFFVSIHLIGFFHSKINRGLKGRRGLFDSLARKVATLETGRPRVWIHASSLGEYEQGRPVVRELQKRIPGIQTVFSLFSPSGYDHIQNEDPDILITYMPMDTWRNARKFIGLVKPDVALVVRHDIWPNYQWRLKKWGIPSILLDASISDRSRRTFVLFAPIIRRLYSTFTRVLAVSADNVDRLSRVVSWEEKGCVTGDTRYDQVYWRSMETGRIDTFLSSGYFKRERCLVAGSTWPAGHRSILPAVAAALDRYPDFKAIIAPHEISEELLGALTGYFEGKGVAVSRYSRLGAPDGWIFRVLLVDVFGVLANLYALGRIAYVGGGFGSGVHSVLEPSAHGCVVLFGPRYLNQVEAAKLIDSQGALFFEDPGGATDILLSLLADPRRMKEYGDNAIKMIRNEMGASERAVDIIEGYFKIGRKNG